MTSGEEIKYGQYIVPPAEDFVKFGVGQPSTSMLPLELIKEAGLSYLNSLTNKSVLQYGDIRGYSLFLTDLAAYLEGKYKTPVDSKHLFVSNGVTDALMLICSLFSSKNPLVVVEDPTYFLAKDIFEKDFSFDIEAVPMEKDGMNMKHLEEIFKKNTNRKILLYTIPTFHNPTSYTLNHAKREQLGKLLDLYPMVTGIADEVYQLLYFTDDEKPPLPLCYYSDNVISLGSFSKILAPSLRMGWMQIRNAGLMKIFVDSGKFDSSGGNTPFVQAIIHGILMSGKLDQNIASCRTFLHNNCTTLAKLVDEKLSEYIDFVCPTGGYFLWLKLKEPLTATALLDAAEDFKIHFHSGSRFSMSGGDNYIRLSFSYYDTEGMKIGVNRLEALCKKVASELTPALGIMGYAGRMGKMLVKEIDYVYQQKPNIVPLGRDLNENIINKCFMIVDVSSPEGTDALLDILLSMDTLTKPLVVGTTGLTKATEKKLEQYSKTAPVAYISNFSKGIPLLLALLDQCPTDSWDVSIVEKHHVHKKDAPSGTALTIASHINKNAPIKSIRKSEIFGEHSVTLSTKDEELTLHHKAKTREVFGTGAVEYIEWICKQKPGLYFGTKTEINFSKYSGCGNDFIMVKTEDFKMPHDQKLHFVKKVCERKLGIGADGVIEVGKKGPNVLSWTYYNKDGTTVELCGNGARCVAKFGLDYNMLNPTEPEVTLVNNFAIVQKASFEAGEVRVEMPLPSSLSRNPKYGKVFPSDLASMLISVAYVVIGVPHLVYKLHYDRSLFHDFPLNKLGEESMKMIQANVSIYSSQGKNSYRIRTYERGVNDETLACGSGCCAAACVEWDSEDETRGTLQKYTMHVASGQNLGVDITETGHFTLRGPATKIYQGQASI